MLGSPEHLYNAHERSLAVTHKKSKPSCMGTRSVGARGGARRSTTFSLFLFNVTELGGFFQSIFFLYTHELVRAKRHPNWPIFFYKNDEGRFEIAGKKLTAGIVTSMVSIQRSFWEFLIIYIT